MKSHTLILRLLLATTLLGLAGCETVKKSSAAGGSGKGWRTSRQAREPDLGTPEWWYARREYDKNYMDWGKMRHPDAEPRWEKRVLLVEDECKAPHRGLGRAGADNGREYKFYGYFKEEKGYEPASDELCAVFVLQRWEPLNASAPAAEKKPAAPAPVPAAPARP